MSKKIKYNKHTIKLYYSSDSLCKICLNDSYTLQVKGYSKGKNYSQVEQEAQLYLIKNAESKKPNLKLNKIVGIQQKINYDQENDGLVKIILRGLAVFK